MVYADKDEKENKGKSDEVHGNNTLGLSHRNVMKNRVAEFLAELQVSNGKDRRESSEFRRYIPGKKIGWDERFASEEVIFLF